MTKVFIQIPCFNEEESLSTTLESLPRHLQGVTSVQWVVIDDGSTDNTVEVARNFGADHIVKLRQNKGLAKAFITGLEFCLAKGADIIVNTDADNQYCADNIRNLIEPILNNKADLVIGARPISEIKSFSLVKRWLQYIGSYTVRIISGTEVKDAPSGFRALSRETAKKINVYESYSYTIETIIQAGYQNLRIENVDIEVNEQMRPSRLVKSNFSYVTNSLLTIIRTFAVYRPIKFFGFISLIFIVPGMILAVRFLFFYFTGHGDGHVQSLIFGSTFLLIAFLLLCLGVLANLVSLNRRLLEALKIEVFKLRHDTESKTEN